MADMSESEKKAFERKRRLVSFASLLVVMAVFLVVLFFITRCNEAAWEEKERQAEGASASASASAALVEPLWPGWHPGGGHL